MAKMKKRIVSLALALFLVAALLPTPALAYGAGTVGQPAIVSAGDGYTGLVDKNDTLWMWGVIAAASWATAALTRN